MPQGQYPYYYPLDNEINRDPRYLLRVLQELYEMLRQMEVAYKGRYDYNVQQRYMYKVGPLGNPLYDPLQNDYKLQNTIQTFKVPEIRDVIEYIEVILGIRAPDKAPGIVAAPEVDEPRIVLTIREDGDIVFYGDQYEFAKAHFEFSSQNEVETFCQENGWTLEINPG